MLISSAFAAAAQDNPIAARMQAFTQAYNEGDAAAIAGFYTVDGAVLPPQGRAVVGRAQIADHYARAFAAGVGNLRYQIVEIRAHGRESAVEIAETLVDVGGRTLRGRSLHVWVLQGGQWWLSSLSRHRLQSNHGLE